MNEIALSSVQEIIKELNMLPNGYIFRGQAEADWRLESSLERVLGDHWTPSQARKFEDYGLAHFKPKFQTNYKKNKLVESYFISNSLIRILHNFSSLIRRKWSHKF